MLDYDDAAMLKKENCTYKNKGEFKTLINTKFIFYNKKALYITHTWAMFKDLA